MHIQITGRIISIGQLCKFKSGNSVTVLLTETDHNPTLIPIEFMGAHIQQTTLAIVGDKVKIQAELTGKPYETKEGTTKHLAVVRGLKIEKPTLDILSLAITEEAAIPQTK